MSTSFQAVDPSPRLERNYGVEEGSNVASFKDVRFSLTASKESNTEVHEAIYGSTKSEALATSKKAEEDRHFPLLKQIEAQRCGLNAAQVDSQHHGGILRNLQFETSVTQTGSSFVGLCSRTLSTAKTEENASQDANKMEESKQLTRKKQRRNGDKQKIKGCRCKKSKCLKLYCECFAARFYCSDTCSCEDCYNTTEYEDSVEIAVENIQSRDPLAFAPRVVNESNSTTNLMDEADMATLPSIRLRKGCNCVLSMCLKNYCDCYQATVGCSAQCRCNRCQNPYGAKADQERNRAEKRDSMKLDYTIKDGKAKIPYFHFLPEGPPVISNLSPLSQPCSTNTSQAQLESSWLQQSGASLPYTGWTPLTFTPQVYGSGSYQFGSDGSSYGRMDDKNPELVKEPSIPYIPLNVASGSPLYQEHESLPLPPASDSEVPDETRNDNKGTRTN